MKLKLVLPILVSVFVGCQKHHGLLPGMPVKSTVVRTFSGVASSNTVTAVDISPFNDETDQVAVSRPNGWSHTGVEYCPATPLCYTLSNTTISLNNGQSVGMSYTITTAITR